MEYAALIVIIIGALITTQIYIKRGLQGRWKSATDNLGDQYDPRTASGIITHRLNGTTATLIQATLVSGGNGFQTTRVDFSNIVETRTGAMTSGPFGN